MSNRRAAWATVLVTATLLMAMTAGCGRRVGPVVDPGEETPAPATSPTTTPSASPSAQPSVAPTPAPVAILDMTAKVSGVVKSGVISRVAIATIQVTNPNQTPVTGTLTCNIGAKGAQTKPISINGGESQSVTFEQSIGLSFLMSTPEAVLEIKTDRPTATATLTYGMGY